jgi:hypothetical protein
MNMPNSDASPNAPALTNGSGAAAILAAGIGSFALAVLAWAGNKLAAVKSSLIFFDILPFLKEGDSYRSG